MRRTIARIATESGFSRLLPWRRAMNLAYHEGRAAHQAFATSGPRHDDLVLAALRDQVRHCRANVPYYADLLHGFHPDFPRTFEEYREMPILEKGAVRTEKERLVSRAEDRSRLHPMKTGGSTGEPVSVLLSDADLGWRLAGQYHHYEQIGITAGSPVGMLYGGEVDVTASKTLLQTTKHWIGNYRSFGCFRMDPTYLMRVHDEFERFQPDLLLGYASAIALLAAELNDRGIKPTYPRVAILSAAERLEEGYRRQVEAIFPAPCVERYGTREISLIGFQRPGAGRGYHIDTCFCLVEPDGTPDADGRAPVLVTTLRARAMPLMRYRLGDLVTFGQGYSPARPVTRIAAVDGRTVDYIYLPERRRVHSIEFPHFFKDFDVRAYQVRQHAAGNVTVGIAAGPSFSGLDRERVERILRQNLAGVHVQFEYGLALARTNEHAKLRPVISECGPDAFTANTNVMSATA